VDVVAQDAPQGTWSLGAAGYLKQHDCPKQGPDFFAKAIFWPGPKKQITLRLDPDVLTFFRKQGEGYQSTINAVLRKYVEARKHRAG
jgi:uncharacterized protein (DUF4415 family)